MKKKINFKNRNGYELSGIVQLPPGRIKSFALFAHCFTCSKNLKAINHISNSLVNKGIGVLRFDFTGLGESEGDFPDTNFTSNVGDLISACEFLNDKFESPELLIGHSLGGSAVLDAATKIKSCKAVVTIAAPSEPAHVVHHFESKKSEIEEKGFAEVDISGRRFKIKKQFFDDLSKQSLLDKVGNLNKALLIFHAPFDNIVGIDNASDIFLAAKHPKSFVSLDRADHLLSNPEDSEYVGSVIAAWSSKYINLLIDYVSPDLELGDYQVVVETGGSGFYSEINAKGHKLVADEPESYGGTNRGPNPYEFLLVSLGTCTNMTLRMYANRKKISLDKVTTRLSHDRIHAEDCEECETKEGKVDVIYKEIEMEGDFTEEQRKRMLEIAEKCPVNKTMQSEILLKSK